MDLVYRPRRLRRSGSLRSMVSENLIKPEDFIYPIFIHDGDGIQEITSMPNIFRWDVNSFLDEAFRAWDLGIKCVVLFPKIKNDLKSEKGTECLNPNGIIPLAIKLLKSKIPEMVIMTDVALDPYSSDGHDGIVSEDGIIQNDETIEILCEQALLQANSGADLIGPSDMMDGRVGAIRKYLDKKNYTDIGIISYSAKYSSAYYGPFRDALDSAPNLNASKKVPSTKDTYQMNPSNLREAIIEAEHDLHEGADILMVKPGLAYLDVVSELRRNFNCPVAAYNVSGEYSMIKAASKNHWINEKDVVLETMISFKRAGADLILSYHACDVCNWLKRDK